MSKKILTLCLVTKENQILLGMKKHGFGEGRWNGFGGKLEESETIEEATKREMREESGVLVNNLEKCGVLDFEFEGNPEILEVHIFHSKDFGGTPSESDEMKPQWFDIDRIPFAEMWPDDQLWLPLFLAGKKFQGRFLFSRDKTPGILEYNLEIVDNFI